MKDFPEKKVKDVLRTYSGYLAALTAFYAAVFLLPPTPPLKQQEKREVERSPYYPYDGPPDTDPWP
jgi:hypothetical protein